jgi:hypothetical protein
VAAALARNVPPVTTAGEQDKVEDKTMFRAEIRWFASGPTLKMEGRLVGDWAEQARCLVTNDVVPKGLIVDLTEVSYVDSVGEQLLKWLGSVGAEFVAGNVYTVSVCERLRLSTLERTAPRNQRWKNDALVSR